VKGRGQLPASEDPLNALLHDLPETYGKMTELPAYVPLSLDP